MESQSEKYYSHEEYFVLEEVAEYRSEYYKGKIVAMTGGRLITSELLEI